MDDSNKLLVATRWMRDHKILGGTGIFILFLVLVFPLSVYLVQQQVREYAKADQPTSVEFRCENIKFYDNEGNLVSEDNLYIDDVVNISVSGNPGGVAVKARFSFDNGVSWTETDLKNESGEFYMVWQVPDEQQVDIKAQVYSPNEGWR